MIGLDCSTALAESYWMPSITHELTHAMLDGAGDESWWEETLAQQVEHEVGGEQPDLSAGNLARSTMLSSLLDPRMPLPSHESYGIAYLFGVYLRQEFGGWPILQAMAKPSAKNADFLSQIAQQAQTALQPPKQSSGLTGSDLGADKLTRDGLLRYFYVALTTNDSNDSQYSILNWQGLKMIPSDPAQETLQPGQAAIFQNARDTLSLNPLLETHRVLIEQNGSYPILPVEPGSQAPAIPAGVTLARDYFLSLNLNETAQSLKLH